MKNSNQKEKFQLLIITLHSNCHFTESFYEVRGVNINTIIIAELRDLSGYVLGWGGG